jgi:predicted HTH domain antitoxin
METHNTTFMNNLRPAKLIAVKISNFAPELQERQLQLGRYSEE